MVVADVVTAAGLSAFAFVVGRFVYLGHEKVWDYYTSLRTGTEVRQLVYCLLRAVGEIVPLARPVLAPQACRLVLSGLAIPRNKMLAGERFHQVQSLYAIGHKRYQASLLLDMFKRG